VLIGGGACELIMDEAGVDFRATKDLDIVLIVEALDRAFADRFWAFVQEGGYEIRERSEGQKILYRFQKPQARDFPAMLELFSRSPKGLQLPEDATLTPLPIAEVNPQTGLMDKSARLCVRSELVRIGDEPESSVKRFGYFKVGNPDTDMIELQIGEIHHVDPEQCGGIPPIGAAIAQL
jgi:hypothetical protein